MRLAQAVSRASTIPPSDCLSLRVFAALTACLLVIRSSIEDFDSERKNKAAEVEKELTKLKRELGAATKDLKKSEQELVSASC